MSKSFRGGDFRPRGGNPPPRTDQAYRPGPQRIIAPGGQTGILRARLVIVSGAGVSGVFVYSGTPGAGNPPIAWLTSSPSDPYGNPVTPGVGATAGAISGTTIDAASLPASAVNFTAVQIGGITTYIQATAPTGSINAGSIWLDSSNGYLVNQYASGAWTPYAYGTNAIQAGSITSALIAAGAIVAGQIAAGAIDGMTINAVTINGNTISAADVIVSGTNGGVFVYGSGGTIVQILTSGTSWQAPAGVTSTKCECVAAGGGGDGSASTAAGGGGGGGEYAAEAALAVTAGNTYTYAVGAAGTSGTSGSGGNGGNTTFAGDSVTVTAHGGSGATGQPGAAGGSGSTNTTHHNGGAGGSGFTSIGYAGGGGGGSGGSGSAGNTGGAGTPGGYGVGAAAVTGGGPGGNGGASGSAGSAPITAPGGGGGGSGGGNASGAGAHGQVKLTYASATPSLIAALAGAAGTDPVAGDAVGAGLTLFNQGSAPSSVTGAALMYGAGGHAKYVDSGGQDYNTGRKTCYSTSTQIISSTTGTAITGYSWLLLSGVAYRIRGRLQYQENASAGAPSFYFTGPALSTCLITALVYTRASGSPAFQADSISGIGSSNLISGPTMSSLYKNVLIEGLIIPSAAGTLALYGVTSAAADTFTIQAGSALDVEPAT